MAHRERRQPVVRADVSLGADEQHRPRAANAVAHFGQHLQPIAHDLEQPLEGHRDRRIRLVLGGMGEGVEGRRRRDSRCRAGRGAALGAPLEEQQPVVSGQERELRVAQQGDRCIVELINLQGIRGAGHVEQHVIGVVNCWEDVNLLAPREVREHVGLGRDYRVRRNLLPERCEVVRTDCAAWPREPLGRWQDAFLVAFHHGHAQPDESKREYHVGAWQPEPALRQRCQPARAEDRRDDQGGDRFGRVVGATAVLPGGVRQAVDGEGRRGNGQLKRSQQGEDPAAGEQVLEVGHGPPRHWPAEVAGQQLTGVGPE